MFCRPVAPPYLLQVLLLHRLGGRHLRLRHVACTAWHRGALLLSCARHPCRAAVMSYHQASCMPPSRSCVSHVWQQRTCCLPTLRGRRHRPCSTARFLSRAQLLGAFRKNSSCCALVHTGESAADKPGSSGVGCVGSPLGVAVGATCSKAVGCSGPTDHRVERSRNAKPHSRIKA